MPSVRPPVWSMSKPYMSSKRSCLSVSVHEMNSLERAPESLERSEEVSRMRRAEAAEKRGVRRCVCLKPETKFLGCLQAILRRAPRRLFS